MKTSYLSLLLVCYCISPLHLKFSDANQADRLQKLIKSKSSGSTSEHDLWYEMLATERFSPVHISSQEGMMEADKIEELPGQPKDVDFDQYAGYVTVDESHGRALFYYFVESPHNSARKPLVLWLNGGPACSSLGYGAMEELGPFRVNSDGKTLTRNYYAWNNVANVLFLESPAGVGFSYSNTTSDYSKSGDKMTAADNYVFLLNWLERFPQYKTRDFFIAGESYAGHYIPQLASLIMQKNKITNQTVINLHGVSIGNAYIDKYSNTIGEFTFLWSHAMVSDETYDIIRTSCNFARQNLSLKCQEASYKAYEEFGNVDGYNIYAPTCDGSNSSSGIGMADFDPCSDEYVYAYLNDRAVQTALHANVTKLQHDWECCSNIIDWNDSPVSVLPIIKELTSSSISFWLYSGDVDAVVSVTSTRYSINMLGLPVKKPWRAWYLNKEVGGYVVEYDGLTLATVRGSGHAVPSYQPQRSLAMIASFLKGQLPPEGTM